MTIRLNVGRRSARYSRVIARSAWMTGLEEGGDRVRWRETGNAPLSPRNGKPENQAIPR